MFDLGLMDVWDVDTAFFRCNCVWQRWPEKEGKRRVRVSACHEPHLIDIQGQIIERQAFKLYPETLVITFDEMEAA